MDLCVTLKWDGDRCGFDCYWLCGVSGKVLKHVMTIIA